MRTKHGITCDVMDWDSGWPVGRVQCMLAAIITIVVITIF